MIRDATSKRNTSTMGLAALLASFNMMVSIGCVAGFAVGCLDFPSIYVKVDVISRKKSLLYAHKDVLLEPRLTVNRIRELFAIVSCTLWGRLEFDNLGVVLQAVFGPSTDRSLQNSALNLISTNKLETLGPAYSQLEQEEHTLGPLGAGQWTGTNPEKFAHSVLLLEGMSSASDWIRTLPRHTLQK